jgi:hypothetical protein
VPDLGKPYKNSQKRAISARREASAGGNHAKWNVTPVTFHFRNVSFRFVTSSADSDVAANRRQD